MSVPPDFSIVIPTYDRPQAIARCLGALANLDADGPAFEVLVVDDGGSADLEALIAPFAKRLRVTLLRQAHAGPGTARNVGLNAARGRWIAFTDDDCLPDSGWLTGFARAAAEFPDRGLGGRTLNLLDRDLYCTAHQLLVDYVTRSSGVVPAEPSFFPSNNLAFPAEALCALGGFDTSFPFAAGEDRDLCARWLAAGHRWAEAPGAVVRHAHALKFGRYCRMHYRYGRGARRFRRKIAMQDGGRVRLEAPRYYAGLMLAPVSTAPARQAPALCATLLLSQVCHAAGYLREKWSER